jgi:lipoprotein signal peptidase
MSGHVRLGLAFAAGILALDQASKAYILYGIDLPSLPSIVVLPVFNLTFVPNTGVTFGLLTGGGGSGALVLAAVAVAVVVALGIWLSRAETALTAAALGAVAGGAIGNVIDRLRLGWVVDFLDFHLGVWHWYVFNLADAAIVCGVAALLIDGLRSRPKPGEQPARVP